MVRFEYTVFEGVVYMMDMTTRYVNVTKLCKEHDVDYAKLKLGRMYIMFAIELQMRGGRTIDFYEYSITKYPDDEKNGLYVHAKIGTVISNIILASYIDIDVMKTFCV